MIRPPLGLGDRLGLALLWLMAALALLILVAPSLIVVAISFDTRSYVSFPPVGFTVDWYRRLAANADLVTAAWISLKVGLLVTGLCVALGVPAALACARGLFRGREALTVFVMLPHMVPGVVLGVAVLFAGAAIDLRPSVSMQSVAVACFVIAVMIRIVAARLARLDIRLEEASANLGASPWQTFRHLTLPLLMPAIWAGGAFTFIEGFDNISVAVFTHGVRDRPLPIELMALVQTDSTPLVAALSTVQILLAVAVLGVVSATIGLERTGE